MTRRAIVLSLAAIAATAPAAPMRTPDASDPVVTGGVRQIAIVHGDTWRSLGARYGVEPRVLAARNNLVLDRPLRAGDVIEVDNRHIVPASSGASIVVNVPQRMLFHFAGGIHQSAYPIAVGQRTWPTPIGDFTVLAMETDPTWDVPISIQEEMRLAGKRVLTKVPPGPENPLGRHWLGLSLPGIGLHGTNAPSSIFRATTHGCIRLHPDDIAAVYAGVSVGERGRTIYEPILVAADPDGPVWLEVHPDVYRKVPNALDLALDLLDRAGVRSRVDVADVRRVVTARDGLATRLSPVTAESRR